MANLQTETQRMLYRKRIIILACLALVFHLLYGCASGGAPRPENTTKVITEGPTEEVAEYVIQAGDTLDIKFYYNPDLNERVTVRPDGMISLQLVDGIKAAKLTPSELKRVLVEKYSKSLRNPEVNIIVKEFSEQKIFVGGEVNVPGVIPLVGKMTSLRAIMHAGGFKNTAAPESVVIIRNQEKDKPLFMTINLKEDMRNPDSHNDVALRPFDVVIVPKSTIAKLNQFMEQYFDKLIPITKTVGFSYFYNLNPENQ